MLTARARLIGFGLVVLWASGLAPLEGWAGAAGKAKGRATSAPQIQIDKSRVDLAGHRLEVRLSHPAAAVEVKVFSEAGLLLADETRDFTGKEAGVPLEVTWSPSSAAAAARIEVLAHDTTGGFAGMAVFSWSVSIPHEEVVFKTDSSEILDGERPKLESSLRAISQALATHKGELGRPTLYIAGHTDTVGADSYNLKLSQARAQSIARWFRGHGVGIPVAYEGFGESALAVETADDVDEARNRRVDYILAVEPPSPSPTPHTTGAHASWQPSWKRIN